MHMAALRVLHRSGVSLHLGSRRLSVLGCLPRGVAPARVPHIVTAAASNVQVDTPAAQPPDSQVPTVPPTLASLPTSEESEDLLRIRHSVSRGGIESSGGGALRPYTTALGRREVECSSNHSCNAVAAMHRSLPLVCPPISLQCAHIMAMAVQRLHKGAQVLLPAPRA